MLKPERLAESKNCGKGLERFMFDRALNNRVSMLTCEIDIAFQDTGLKPTDRDYGHSICVLAVVAFGRHVSSNYRYREMLDTNIPALDIPRA